MVVVSLWWVGWLVVASLRLVVVRYDWFWLVVINCGGLWLVVFGCDWLWMVVAGYGWFTGGFATWLVD